MQDREFRLKAENILNVWELARFGKKAKKKDKRQMNRYRRRLENRQVNERWND